MKTNQNSAKERQKQEEKESKEKHKKYINTQRFLYTKESHKTQNTSYNPSILIFFLKKKPLQ